MPPKHQKNSNETPSDPEMLAAPAVTLSSEQFQQLLAQINVACDSVKSSRDSRSISPVASVTENQSGNFTKCTCRFDGSPESDVDAFIDAVLTYKDCVNITDKNALRGLTLLLEGVAATWWSGIKSSVKTFDDAVKALKDGYSRKLPPHLVFREIFSREQEENETTELFVCHMRSLIAQLPYELPEQAQIDMIYGLLHRRIRKRVTRTEVNTFENLLSRTRDVEASYKEVIRGQSNVVKDNLVVKPTKKLRPKCNFCRKIGHLEEECRKKKQLSPSNEASTLAKSSSAVKPSRSTLVCYGCQQPGYVRSNCPNCSSNKPSTPTTPFDSLDFSTVSCLDDDVSTSRPMMHIQIYDANGIACIDTGAKCCIAGSQLRNILLRKNHPYTKSVVDLRLADGESRRIDVELFDIEIIVQNRTIPIQLVAVPEHNKSRMLLGMNFIKTAGIVLDFTTGSWYFGDDPKNKYPFVEEHSFAVKPSSVDADCASAFSSEDDADKQQSRLDALIAEYVDVFSTKLETTPFAEHAIKLTDDTPIAVPPYRMSPARKQYLKNELDKMLADDIIEECESPYAAPVVLVPKRDGSLRLCVDYRRLNAVTVPDRYPLPRVDDLLHATKPYKYMSTIDLRSGYWQVPVKPEDRDKTAFTTPFGNFRFKKMPFGLRNAPSTFQRLMDRLRSGLTGMLILIYLDDLIILSSTFDEHIRNLRAVLERLRQFKLHANLDKCHFMLPEIKYLGHVITHDGIKPDPSKISAIAEMKTPSNVKELLTFLQTGSWFRRFVPNHAAVARPLSDLTKRNTPWTWGPAQEEAFCTLKKLLTSTPILQQADPDKPYILRTDASKYALGAVLMQGETPDQHPVEYASRLLTAAERNYSTTEREALAVLWAMERFRGYVEGAQVSVISDHQPLRWLMSLKSPSGRLARWALALQSYDLNIDYTPGRQNVIADMLSRPPGEPENICIVSVDMPSIHPENLRQQQLDDPEVKKIINSFEAADDAVDVARWTERGYLMLNGILYRYLPDGDEEEAMLVVPKEMVPKILHEYHDSPTAGHYGVEKTIQKISSRYYWVGMRRTITEHVKSCIECQRFKPSNQKPAGLLQTPVQHRRFEVISIDLFGPLPAAPMGERWIFVVEDTATRWVELFALRVATAEACARCLIDEIVLRYGTPRRVVSDNGTQFVSEVMQKVAHCLGFKQSLIPVYHPESNPVERKNRDIKCRLAIYTSECHDKWTDHLPSIRFAMNSTVSQATGHSPAYLCFGRELRTPDDVEHDLRTIIDNAPFVPQITPYLRTFAKALTKAREVHESQQDHSKEYGDEKRRPGIDFSVGDRVLVLTHVLSKAQQGYTQKFAPKRDGPYVITKQISPTSYQLASPQTPDMPLGVYHSSALTPYRSLDNTTPDPEPARPLKKRGRPRRTPTSPTEADATCRPRGRPRKETVAAFRQRPPTRT